MIRNKRNQTIRHAIEKNRDRSVDSVVIECYFLPRCYASSSFILFQQQKEPNLGWKIQQK